MGLTSGFQNTFIGAGAGSTSSQLATAQNSIAIGYNAFTTKNNQVVLGNSSIVETVLNGKIVIDLPSISTTTYDILTRNTTTGIIENVTLSTIRGFQGPQGFRGFQGVQGFQGPRGFQGFQGFQGLQGGQGFQGPQGFQGFQGLQGTQGFQGLRGFQGFQGNSGISAGAVYYFNQSQSSDVSPYKVLTTQPNGVQQIVTTNLAGSEQDALVTQFLTPELGFAVIPGGTQRFHFHYLKQASNDAIETYATIQLADSTGTPIGPVIQTGTSLIDWVDASIPVEVTLDLTLSTIAIDPTNRMIVKIYLINNDSSAHVINWYTEGNQYYAFVMTTVGVIGNQGAQGSQGPIGFQGVQGVQGPQGAIGSTGATGNTPIIPRSFGVVFDGGGSVLTTGLQADVVIPYAMTITGWTMLGDVGGTASVDIWSAPYATYPPTIANTIIGATGTKPNLAGSIKGQSTTLTNWTTGVTAGDIIRFNLDSVTTQTRISLTIQGNQ
jgi:hypothetical protein